MTRRGLLLPLLLLAACSSFKSASSAGADAGAEGGALDAGPAQDASSSSDSAPSPNDAAPDARDAGSSDSSSSTPDSSAGDSSGGGDGSSPDGGSAIEVVVDNLNQPTLVRVDTQNVYFGDEGTSTGTVYQCPKTGCTTPITLGPGYATGMGVDSTNVYWNDFSGGTIVACAIGGCSQQPTVIAPTQPSAEGVAFDGTNLFWATNGNVVTCVPPACSTRTTLATGQDTRITLLAAAAGIAYWPNNGTSNGSLESCPAAGCNQMPTTLTSQTGVVMGNVFVYDMVAYFTSGKTVASCPVGGCTAPNPIGVSDDPYGVATDGAYVYWLDDLDQVVFRCPVTGCTGGAERFADMQLGQPGANVALDGEYAYWTAGGQVLRKHK